MKDQTTTDVGRYLSDQEMVKVKTVKEMIFSEDVDDICKAYLAQRIRVRK